MTRTPDAHRSDDRDYAEYVDQALIPPDALTLSGELRDALEANQPAAFSSPVDPKSLPVRISRLKLFAQSPAHYYDSCQRVEWRETMAMRLGSGVHAMVLGTPIVKYPGRRAGKAWDGFARDHAGEVILSEREWHEALQMSAAILRHREAMMLLFEGTLVEQPIDWEYLGRKARSIPDARGTHHVADLKTDRTAHPSRFVSGAIRMFYHCQLAFYGEAAAFATGIQPNNHYVVVVEKFQPYPITILRLTDRAIEQAQKTIRLWMEQLFECERSGHWPAYTEQIVDFDMPDDDDFGPVTLEINGRMVEVSP